MRQWAVDLSGQAHRSGNDVTHTWTLIGRSTSSVGRVRIVLHERSAARIDGCGHCCVTTTLK